MTVSERHAPPGPDGERSLSRRALRWLLVADGPLKERVMRGGVWLLIGEMAARAAGVAKLVILGRLLSPNDFGLMGIGILALRWADYFTQTGFNIALIQRAGDIRPYFDTAWTVQVIRGLGLSVLIFLAAPAGAWFFENPEALPVIQAIGLVALVRALTNPAVVYLRKDLDFQREVMWRSTGVIAGAVVSVLGAIVYPTVWVLVLGVIVAEAVEAAVSYWMTPYRPHLRFEPARAWALTRIGKWIFFGSLVEFLALYADSVVVGKVLGATALGLYVMALQLAMGPSVQIGIHARGVVFPAFVKLHTGGGLRHAFLRTIRLVASVVLPVACFLTVFAEPLVRILLGTQWLSIVPALRILTWAGAGAGLAGFMTELLTAVGKLELAVRASLVKVVLLLALLYPLTTAWGITGAAVALVAATLAATGTQAFLVSRLIRPTRSELLVGCRVGLLGSVPIASAAFLLPGASLAWGVLVGGLAMAMYLAILLLALRLELWSAGPP
ncbi:MAG: oligosaccharide flippase family protein [Candidatus Rokubacteria bacterium]|nr:oligosaccharide flippase family protein [Candidatus Rokubacteria bacterium]